MEIAKSGFNSNTEALERLRNEFIPQQCSVIPHFLSFRLAQQVSQELEHAEFAVYTTLRPSGTVLDTEMKISGSNVWVHALHLLLNDQRLFDAIEYITGCPKIASFQGRISRHSPNCNHHSDWHDDRDVENERLVGISINLSARPYSGGQFQIRRKGEERTLAVVSHFNPGAAHIFTIADALHHRVTAVCGDSPRTALAGWFRSAPDRWNVIREHYCPPDEVARIPAPASSDAQIVTSIQGVLQVPDFVLSQSVGDAVILLNMKTRKYYALNAFAAELWKLLSTRQALPEVIDQISDKYPRERQARKCDLEDLAMRLIELDLLTACG